MCGSSDGGANLAGWPGKNRLGTKLVGRLGLANGTGTCVVTSHVQTVGRATITIHPGGQSFPHRYWYALSMATSIADKARENRLRRMAERQGLLLQKSRRRDRRALSFGTYWLVDPYTNTLALHDHTLSRHSEIVGVSLDDIERYLTGEDEQPTDAERADVHTRQLIDEMRGK
jgi:hypothetical protein